MGAEKGRTGSHSNLSFQAINGIFSIIVSGRFSKSAFRTETWCCVSVNNQSHMGEWALNKWLWTSGKWLEPLLGKGVFENRSDSQDIFFNAIFRDISKKSSKDSIVAAKFCPGEVTEKHVKPGALWLRAASSHSPKKGKRALVDGPHFIFGKVRGNANKTISGEGLK